MNENIDVQFDIDREGPFIKVRSLTPGKHFAIHRTYIQRSEIGEDIIIPITTDVKDYLLANIELKGITEGFILNDNHFKLNNLINANEIRHTLGQSEINFTSTGDKLNYHWPIFNKLRDTGFGSIIRATLTLHQVCASRCHFCSTINRNKKDSISLEEAKDFVNKLYFDQAEFNKKYFNDYNELYSSITGTDIRLKSIILSGGGQPNLWPHFTEFVSWLSELDIELGLITNGFPEKVNDEVYKNFKWVRLSITPEDASPFYKNNKFNLQRIPDILKNNNEIAFGLSYVYGSWTSNDILKRIGDVIEPWGLEYVRMLTDCNLGRAEQLNAHKNLAEKLFKLNYINENGEAISKIFHQLKYHGTQNEAEELFSDGKCFLQTYNVFWDTTGHEVNGHSSCYPCDSVTVLANDENNIMSERGFNSEKWGTVKNSDVHKLYTDKWDAFFDPRENCAGCLFMNNNRKVKSLIQNGIQSELDLINPPKHVNFP